MTLRLTNETIYKIKNFCRNILGRDIVSIRELAKLIGNLVASSPAVTFGLLHYRYLGKTKIWALKLYKE